MGLIIQPIELTGKQKNTLDGQELLYMMLVESLTNSNFSLKFLPVKGQHTGKRKDILQHLGLISSNTGADGVIISNCTCTDPEYLLFARNSWDAFSFRFPYI